MARSPGRGKEVSESERGVGRGGGGGESEKDRAGGAESGTPLRLNHLEKVFGVWC